MKKNKKYSHLPVELAVVDHREHAQGLDGRDRAHGALGPADLDDVDGVVVALGSGSCFGSFFKSFF
jgi:hypothetical protein